jgi:hypothetical protein
MKCLSPAEAEALLSPTGFRVSLKNDWYKRALVLDPPQASLQTRVVAEQPSDFGRIRHFIWALNRWLPIQKPRLFWVDHWAQEQDMITGASMAAVIWRGLGESRPLLETPGLLFDAFAGDLEDQEEIMVSQQTDARGLIVALITTLMMTESDGWLISPGSTDRVEFWEGHVFFHSADKNQQLRGLAIFHDFGCRLWPESGGPPFPKP